MTDDKLGATGKFPDGKISEDDEGEIKLGITHTKNEVILSFGKPVTWIGISPEVARSLAGFLNRRADMVEKKKNMIGSELEVD